MPTNQPYCEFKNEADSVTYLNKDCDYGSVTQIYDGKILYNSYYNIVQEFMEDRKQQFPINWNEYLSTHVISKHVCVCVCTFTAFVIQ